MQTISRTSDELRVLRERLEATPMAGLDYETSSPHPHPEAPLHVDKLKPVGFGIGFPGGERTYVPLAHAVGETSQINADYWEASSILDKFLSDPTKEVWAHSSQFEQKVSRIMGIEAKAQWRDSMLAQYLLNKGLRGNKGYKLKPAVEKYLDHSMIEMHDILEPGQRFNEISPEETASYCGDDAFRCLELGSIWLPDLRELGLMDVFERLYCPFSEVLMHMEEVGFGLDPEHVLSLKGPWQEEMGAIAKEFKDLCGCSISSDSDVAKAMFEDLQWWPVGKYEKMEKSGRYSVRAAVREELMMKLSKGSKGYKALELKNRYSTIAKLVSTYTDSLVKAGEMYCDGRVRSNFKQTGTVTGRLSSAAPNLQNVPSKGEGVVLRNGFKAAPGWVLCDADYSQADLVVMAHLSGDPMLLKAYHEGIDLHQQTADNCYCDRPTGKTLNLGLIYEMRSKTLAENLGISMAHARMIYQKWHETYRMVGAYHRRQHMYAKKHGMVRTITDRIRYLPDIHSQKGWLRAQAEREASNSPCQGSVSDIIEIAMNNLYQEWKDRGVLYDFHTGEGKAKIVSQVHDEVITELREDFKEEGMADTQRHMENAVELAAPMTVTPGLGERWLDAKKDASRREKEAA